MTLIETLQLIKTKLSVNGSIIILLSGDLGAGKTYLTNRLAQEVGITQKLPSPTFTFLQEYPCNWEGKTRFVHCDFYRIEQGTEEKLLEQIGFWDYIDEKTIIVIEWPEKAGTLLDSLPTVKVNITLQPSGERTYEIA